MTPALAIQSVSRPTERHIRSRIGRLPEELAGLDGDGPVLVMIGLILRDMPEQASAELIAEARRSLAA
jgi:siroheme synthase